uniref:Uncharacterized protein n=1 Tax=Caenorhabditis japonica TaxID=281687 RepID=A0A8R1HJ85_CAEJA
MSERKKKLVEILKSSLSNFQEVIINNSDASKLARHSGLEKRQIDEFNEKAMEKTVTLAQQKISEMMSENQLVERFEELEKLIEESDKLNRQLDRPIGYQSIKPKNDLRLHLVATSQQSIIDSENEIKELESELNAIQNDVSRQKEVYNELVAPIEKQQQKLWCS